MPVTRVVDPEGNEWVVCRKWVHRRLRWRGPEGLPDLLQGADLVAAGGDVIPVIGVVLTVAALVLVAVVAVLFVVPAVIFLVELLLVVAIVALGLTGRLLLGRPWTVQARQSGAGPVYEWKVRGWRASGDRVSSVAEQLRATGVPAGGTAIPSRDAR